MAKQAKEKSAAAKALEASQDKLKKAKEAYAKNENAANKKAVADAEAEVKKHLATVNRERFEDVAGTRVANALKALKNLQNCASTRSYRFTLEDVNNAETAINQQVKDTFAAFRNSLQAPTETGGKTATKFKF